MTERPYEGFPTAGLLILSQGLYITANTIVVATSALVGEVIAPTPSLATWPAAFLMLGTMVGSNPIGAVMARYGRRAGFISAGVTGLLGSILATIAVYTFTFWMFLAGLFMVGVLAAGGQFFRFAAAEVVQSTYRNRAISFVMLGGIIAALIGPQLANATRDLFISAPYSGAYFSQAFVIGVCLLAMMSMRFPIKKVHNQGTISYREALSAFRNPTLLAAQIVATFGYMIMSFVMTSTPLAMAYCGHSFSDTASVIGWHVVSMFLPSFFTGSLVDKFGGGVVMALGGGFIGAALLIGFLGIDVTDFWLSLVFLGLGWNFCYVGGSCVIKKEIPEKGAAQVEGLSGFILMAGVTLATFGSGYVFETFGWFAQLMSSVPAVILIIGVALFLLYQPASSAKPPQSAS